MDHGSDHELLIAKLGLTLKKVGKTTRPFSYDLNQIPYDYTVDEDLRICNAKVILNAVTACWPGKCDLRPTDFLYIPSTSSSMSTVPGYKHVYTF